MAYWPHLLAILVGAGLMAQVGMNATLGRVVGSPLMASVLNFAVGLAALVLVAVAGGARPAPGSLGQVPAWAWLGGLCGAAYVAAATVLGPRLGAMALLALVLLGQMGASLAIDSFGVMGFPRSAVTLSKLLGAALLVSGVLLIVRR